MGYRKCTGGLLECTGGLLEVYRRVTRVYWRASRRYGIGLTERTAGGLPGLIYIILSRVCAIYLE